MTAEGSEKTWDQCRIKLKNLKSQYRYVKDRIPNIDEVDLEDDDVLKQLIAECQGRGISPSNIKHLRYLRRFLRKTQDFSVNSQFKSSPLEVNISPGMAMATSSASAVSPQSIHASASMRTSFPHPRIIDHEGKSLVFLRLHTFHITFGTQVATIGTNGTFLGCVKIR